MAKALNYMDTWRKSLLAEISYNRCLQASAFLNPSGTQAIGWVKDELVTQVPKALKRDASYARQAAMALSTQYGKIRAVRQSRVGDNSTGADMFIVRDRLTGRYVLCVDGTALSGGNPGEGGRDIVANFNNFFDATMTPHGELKAQIDMVESFWIDFCNQEASDRSKTGARVTAAKIAAETDVIGHSLGGLVAIYLKRLRDSKGAPIGEVLGWSPPAEGGGITLIPGIGALFSALLRGEGISILTTWFDIAKLAGARPKGTVFNLGAGPQDAIKAHMIYWHTHLLEKGLKGFDAFLKKFDCTPAQTQKMREAAFLFRSSRAAEPVLRLPLGKDGRGEQQHVYVSEGGGSLITGGPITIAHRHYEKFLATGETGHIHQVLLKLALKCGSYPNPEKIPEQDHTIGKVGQGFALVYQQLNDYRMAFLNACGDLPKKRDLYKYQIKLGPRVGLKVLKK